MRADLLLLSRRAVMDERLRRSDLLILGAIGSFADPDTAWARVSLQTLARKSKYSLQTVVASIKRLSQCGYLRVRKRRAPGGAHEHNEYLVAYDPADTPTQDALSTPEAPYSTHEFSTPTQAPQAQAVVTKALVPGKTKAPSTKPVSDVQPASDENGGVSTPRGGPAGKVTWLTPYLEAFQARFGAPLDPGYAAKHLAPVHKTLNGSGVAAFTGYLAELPAASMLNLPKFAAAPGCYLPAAAPPGTGGQPPPTAEEERAARERADQEARRRAAAERRAELEREEREYAERAVTPTADWRSLLRPGTPQDKESDNGHA